MKRNESVLVYAVTGLLLVILLVAVIFGEEPAHAGSTDGGGNPVALGPEGGAKGSGTGGSGTGGPVTGGPGGAGVKIANLPGVARAKPTPAGDKGAEPKKSAASGGPGPDPKEAGATDPGAPAEKPSADKEGAGAKTLGPDGAGPDRAGPDREGPDREGKLALDSRVVDSPAKRLENLLGTSERTGAYRLVKTRRNDTLETVVRRWCAGAEHLDEALGLNEHLSSGVLTTGTGVVVPFVEAEVILAAEKTRRATAAKVEHAKGELYSLKKGDSLWKLASKRVAANLIPAWLERFRQLNPEITDPDVLVEGQKVRLPR